MEGKPLLIKDIKEENLSKEIAYKIGVPLSSINFLSVDANIETEAPLSECWQQEMLESITNQKNLSEQAEDTIMINSQEYIEIEEGDINELEPSCTFLEAIECLKKIKQFLHRENEYGLFIVFFV